MCCGRLKINFIFRKESLMERKCIFNLIIEQLSLFLSSPTLLLAHRYPNHFVRKGGMLTIRHVVLYLLNCSRQAMHTNIILALYRKSVEFPNVTKQAVSKARQGIMPSLFRSLFDQAVKVFYDNIGSRKALWLNRYPVFAVDGSKLQLPGSSSIVEKYGSCFSKKNPERTWSLALASTIYDVCNDCIAHAVIKPYLASERAAAKEHFQELESLGILQGSVIVFDRGYYSEDMFRFFSAEGHMCVMRLKEGINLSKECSGDTISTLPGDPKKGTEDIKVRVISIDLGNGITEYLATNIFDNDLTADNFKDLYFQRWKIEGKYYELKTTFRLEAFNGSTCTSIEQEFFIAMLFSNLAALVKAEADIKIKETAKPTNKHKYQANRAHIIGHLKFILAWLLTSAQEMMEFYTDTLFESASKNKSQIQPNRHDPRNVKRGERKYRENRKTAV